MKYLVETALLTHGLCSITNDEMAQSWHCPDAVLAWVDHGELRLGLAIICLSGSGPQSLFALIVTTWRKLWKSVPAVL